MLILHKSVHFKNKNLKEIIEITYYNTLNWKYVTDNIIFFKYENFYGFLHWSYAQYKATWATGRVINAPNPNSRNPEKAKIPRMITKKKIFM